MFYKESFFKTIHYEPHESQWLIHNSLARFRTAVCGRRFGKTFSAASEVAYHAAITPEAEFWIAAPTYGISNRCFSEVFVRFNKYLPEFIEKQSISKQELTLVNGSLIKGVSSDNPVSLLGAGLSGVVVDEADKMAKRIWTEYLRPTLSDNQGWALFTTSPWGKDWIYDMFMYGKNPEKPEYESWNFPTALNPYIPASEIVQAKKDLPEEVFREQYLAEFVEGGQVFRRIEKNVKGTCREMIKHSLYIAAEPIPKRKYVIGCDIAKHQDWTVIIVLDTVTRHVVYFERFNKLDWGFQKYKIAGVSDKYNKALIILDATGAGDVVFDDLVAMQCNVRPYKFTNINKVEMIRNLVLALDNGDISYPYIAMLIHELTIFNYKRTTSGNYLYSAPEGMHDDCVTSLGLVVYGLRQVVQDYIKPHIRRR